MLFDVELLLQACASASHQTMDEIGNAAKALAEKLTALAIGDVFMLVGRWANDDVRESFHMLFVIHREAFMVFLSRNSNCLNPLLRSRTNESG